MKSLSCLEGNKSYLQRMSTLQLFLGIIMTLLGSLSSFDAKAASVAVDCGTSGGDGGLQSIMDNPKFRS